MLEGVLLRDTCRYTKGSWAIDTGVTPRQEDTKMAVPVASLTVVDVGPPSMKIGRKGKTPAATQKAGLSTPNGSGTWGAP
jgi:hypothetical protein